MKKNFYLKSLLSLLLLFVGMNAWATDSVTQTYTLSTNDNGTVVTTGDVKWSVGTDAITASSSNTKLTGTITVTLPTGANLASVEITKSNSWGSGATVVFASGSTTLNTFTSSGTFSLTSNKTDLVYTFTKGGTSSKNAWVKTISVTYTTPASTTAASAPTLTAAGSFVTSKDVTITNNESDATVYYTTDGNDPTTTSSSFTGESTTITISATTTVKAMAVVSGKDNSSIASATYTMLTPYTSFTEALAAATSTAKEVAFTFSGQVVTAASTKNAYLQDASGNVAIIYNSTAQGFTQKQTISGTVICSIQKYNGVLEFTNLTSSTEGITTGSGTPTATTKALAAVTASDYGKLVKIENLVYDGTNSVFKDGENTITPYNTFMTLPTFTNGATYTVTGIFLTYTKDNVTTFEIAPRTSDDVVKTAEPLKSTPTVSFANATVQVAYTGGDVPTNALTNDGGTPTYTSSNPEVATVNSSTGAVTLVAPGLTTITATTAETDDYFTGTASYKLLYLSGDGSEEHPYSAVDLNNVTGLTSGTSMIWVSGKILGSSTKSGTGVAATAADTNIALGDDAANPSLENTITVNVVAALRTVLNLTTDNTPVGKTIKVYARYNNNYYNRCGLDGNASQKIAGLADDLSVSSVGYATYYDAAAWVVPTDLTVKYVSAAADGVLTWKEYAVGATVPAKTGVVVSGAEADYPITYIGAGTSAPTNLLKGSVTSETTTGGDKYYMLSLDENSTAGSVGFYYGADNGAAFTNGAHKAYLALTTAQAGSAKAFVFNEGDVDAINAVETSVDMNAPVYNLAGQRVAPSTKGILIQNGKKFINK